ncbi:MAG: 16S rRNA (cytidine(1402)-2'-O)-methyltransferase [Xanthomonadales bacterium]|nr:16S rRNA (cytidine(1402)-2'-O)-methyltransferase [Xanthomonadales bacterium]
MAAGALYVVSTPIGNLQDITLRAIEVLGQVDLIAAEDTRHSRKLLERHGLTTPMVAVHEHNEAEQASSLVGRMLSGESIALISDAGTPLLSDPGFRLVQAAAQAGIAVSPVPGASAITAALCVSALPTDRFAFEGFLPAKPVARRKRLAELADEPRTLVLFESSHRIVAAVKDLAEAFGPSRSVALCRELTKQFETILRGSLQAVARRVEDEKVQQKGEFVVVVSGHETKAEESEGEGLRLAQALLEYLPASQAAKVAAKITGASRRALYQAVGKSDT